MDLTPYVDNVRHELAVAAESGGDDARALAERLTAPLESAIRLTLLDVLSAAADEITRDLAPGSVDLRLRGRDPGFAVTPPPDDRSFEDMPEGSFENPPSGTAASAKDVPPPGPPNTGEGATSRINFRLSEHLKLRIEEAAGRAGLSVNAWLVRAAAAALEPDDRDRRSGRRGSWGGQHYSGWVRCPHPAYAPSPLVTTSENAPPDPKGRRTVMPTFDTPEPISVTIDLVMGEALIIASDRRDTIVKVRPSKKSRESDVKAAEQTRVEYSEGRLLVKASKQRGLRTYFGGGSSIDVVIELPEGSHVQGEAAMAELRSEGRLGECRFKTGAGAVRLDCTGRLDLKTGTGTITVDRAVGHAEITTGSGTLRIREIDGTAVLKNSNGDTKIGEVTGDLRLSAANGPVSVDRAHAAVRARTANGSIRIGEVVRGSIALETAFGELDVGIREGTAALLDVHSQFGKVRNSLDATDGPEPSDETVELRARTSYGDVVIRRS